MNDERYVFHPAVIVTYREGRVCLVDADSTRTHVVTGRIARAISMFVAPQAIPHLLERLCEGDLQDFTAQFIRLISARFILAEQEAISLQSDRSNVSTPYWPDAYLYHALARTTDETLFESIEAQDAYFREVLRRSPKATERTRPDLIALGAPSYRPTGALGDVLGNRRSRRIFLDAPVPFDDVSWLLFMAYGNQCSYYKRTFGHEINLRTSPSAGGLQSIRVHLLALNVEGLPRGVYRYHADGHALSKVASAVTDEQIVAMAAGQPWVTRAGFLLLMSADVRSAALKYNASRVYRLLYVEGGHFGQTALLCADAIGKSTCMFGAANEEAVERVFRLDSRSELIISFIAGGETDPDATFADWGSVPR